MKEPLPAIGLVQVVSQAVGLHPEEVSKMHISFQ